MRRAFAIGASWRNTRSIECEARSRALPRSVADTAAVAADRSSLVTRRAGIADTRAMIAPPIARRASAAIFASLRQRASSSAKMPAIIVGAANPP